MKTAADVAPAPPLTIVAIGASAGGVDALQGFFAAMPADERFAFVVITHLSPQHASQMAEILGRSTSMPVSEALDDEIVQPSHVYVIPPDRFMGIKGRKLSLEKVEPRPAVPHPIDHFMRALADDQQERAVGIVLSGADHDGSIGLKEIKAAGGLVLAQDLAEAHFPSMPASAIKTAVVDAVLPVGKMGKMLVDYLRYAPISEDAAQGPQTESADDADDVALHLDEVLALLLERTGRDFSWYRRPMLRRRLRRRIGLRGLADADEYLALLGTSAEELQCLLKDFLISVTEFFRQPDAWQTLEAQVLPHLVDECIKTASPVRVWTAGCATGEETYSIAMLLQEQVDSRGADIPIQVFGSDIDVDALEVARSGSYPESIVGAMPLPRLARFFEKQGEHYVVRKALREKILFAPQDLARDPSFSKLDLIICRNVLIYLEPVQQSRILEVFHFALKPGGVLFLGKSESLGSQVDQFEALSRPYRIFRRIGSATRTPRLFEGKWSGPGGFLTPARSSHVAALSHADITHQQLAGRSADAAVLINAESRVLFFHGRTAHYLEPRGEPTTNVSHLLRYGLRRSVRTLVHRVHSTRQAAHETATLRRDDKAVRVSVQVEPVGDFARNGLLLVVFDTERDGVPPAPSAGDVMLEEELHRMRDDLAAIESEGETASAELRIANEEAMSLNEELQSANEELQTSKEELQSMNEELSSVNGQLEEKLAELELVLGDLRNLMDSTQVATLLLDRELRIRRFTEPTRRLFYLIASDVGRPLRDIAACVNDTTLLRDAANVRENLVPVERELTADDGVHYLRRILPYRTRDDRIDGVVITYTDISALLNAAAEARRLAAVMNDSNDAVIVYDFDGKIRSWNRGASMAYGYDPPAAVRLNMSMLEPATEAGCAIALAKQACQSLPATPVTARRITRDGRTLDVSVTVSALRDEAGVAYAVVSTERDISEKLRLEAEVRFRAMTDLIPILLKIEDANGNAEFFNRAWPTFVGLSSTQPLLGVGWHSYVHPDDLKTFLQRQHKARRELKRFEIDVRMRNGFGGYCWTRTSEVARRNASGAVIGYVSIGVDIDERKAAEQTIAQEAARKDEFLAMLAHELRNPLAAVSNAIAVIAHDGTADAQDTKVRWATGVIARQVQQLARLVDDLMDVARVSSGKIHLERVPVEVQLVVQRARDQVEPAIQARSQRLEIRVPTEPMYVEGDLTRLTQVVSNLLSNASKYSEKSARLIVEAIAADGDVVLKVMDNGLGISAEMLPRVFDLFAQEDTTVDRAQGGLGLGLTLVKRLVAAHGGTVTAHSAGRGHGSEFVVRLPLLTPPPQSDGEMPDQSTVLARSAYRILIVDDEADGADTLSMLLRQKGYEVDTASDGPSALDLAARKHPDAIVLDIGLPGMTGYEVAQRLRSARETADILLIALTGYGRPEDSTLTGAACFDFHFVKPADASELVKLFAKREVRSPPG